MTESDRTRRSVLRGTAGVAVAGLGLAGIVAKTPHAAAGASVDDPLLAEAVELERNDGRVDAVTVAPELTVTWENYGDGVSHMDVTIAAGLEEGSGVDVLAEERVESTDRDGPPTVDGDGFDEIEGSVELAFDRYDVTDRGESVTEESFADGVAPGESKTTGVEVIVRIDVVGRQGESTSIVETAAFDVTVTNPDGEAAVTGRVHTGAA